MNKELHEGKATFALSWSIVVLVAGVLGYYLLSNADSAPGDSGLVYFIWGIGLLLFTVVQLPVMLPVCFLMATAGLGGSALENTSGSEGNGDLRLSRAPRGTRVPLALDFSRSPRGRRPGTRAQ